jgi:hypothetical protein
VTSSNQCVAGLHYESDYMACIADSDAGDAGDEAAPSPGDAGEDGPEESGMTDAEGGAEGGGSSNFGAVCDASTQCMGGPATYCVMDPTMPGMPGICTLTPCNPPACGTGYGCCDCSKSSNALVNGWPHPLCIPSAKVAMLELVGGCTCQ